MRKTARAMNEIMWAAPFVMGVRLSRMMLPEQLRSASDRSEDKRMVAEKLAAAASGMVAMQTEIASQMMDAWMGMAFGKMPNVNKAVDDIASAGLKSTRRTVKANAKRLGKSGKTK